MDKNFFIDNYTKVRYQDFTYELKVKQIQEFPCSRKVPFTIS